MSVVNNNLLLTADAGVSQYQVSRSLRFNSADSAYLNRTPSVAGNRKTWTWAAWVKRSKATSAGGVASYQVLFEANGSSVPGDRTSFMYNGDTLDFFTNNTTSSRLITTQIFRDFSAWQHVVLSVDTTQATAANRVRVFINGTQVTTFSTSSYPSQNLDTAVTTTTEHRIGKPYDAYYFDGYLADVHLIDGQALTPSSFTETNATTGQLVPKAYTGTYGTNGFRLNFSDNSAATAATLGADSSGNGNNWTPNNLSVTAGTGNDSLTDTPTSYGTDTGAGGEVRGNYCTWNPNSSRISTLSNGNITVASAGGNADSRCNATIAVSSGKWYYEIALNGVGTNSSAGIGQNQITTLWPGNDSLSYAFELDNARTAQSSNLVAYGSALGSGDVFMCAFDLDSNKIYFGKNGTWFNSSNPVTGANPAFTITSGTYTPIARPYNANTTGVSFDTNFGQRPFAYAAPSGFKALCDTNLPDTPGYATLNPLDNTATLSNGNLDVTWAPASYASSYGTVAIPSTGSWYYECNVTSSPSYGDLWFGISLSAGVGALFNTTASFALYRYDGLKGIDGVYTAYAATYNLGDKIGVAINVDSGQITFYKNGVSQGAISYSLTGKTMFPCFALYAAGASVNFGKTTFTYAAPSGFKALDGSITTSGTFTGNASADGPFVYLNGVPTSMRINNNAVTFATQADKLANGFKVRSSSGTYNTAGTNTYSITATGAKFKYARAQANP